MTQSENSYYTVTAKQVKAITTAAKAARAEADRIVSQAAAEAAANVDLSSYDVILVNSSAGKDSQVALDVVFERASAQGVADRIVVVHCDLGRAEWKGTLELARDQAALYGARFEVVRRDLGDLLDQIEARGKFPDSQNRYCTSDQKTSQVLKLMTRLVREANHPKGTPVRILNCLGIRADESSERAKKLPFHREEKASNGLRTVDRWLPIFDLTDDEVWARIKASGVPYHPAYDAGMPRLSCCFCVLAGKDDLILSAKLNPELAAEYVALEERIGFQFVGKPGASGAFSMADIVAAAAR